MAAAARNRNPEIIRALAGAGAEVNTTGGKHGTSALMLAALNNRSEVVAALLESGADVEARDLDGLTPLMYAARYSDYADVIMVLLKDGADAKLKDHKGKTAFDYAHDNTKLKGADAYMALEAATDRYRLTLRATLAPPRRSRECRKTSRVDRPHASLPRGWLRPASPAIGVAGPVDDPSTGLPGYSPLHQPA